MSKQKKYKYHQKKISRENKYTAHYLIISAILLLTTIVFSNSLNNAFTGWDDPEYLTKNPFIRELSYLNIKSFFTQVMVDNYQPLVMLSYAIEYKFFGLSSPVPFHTTNLIFHLLNVILVFVFIRKLTEQVKIATVVTLIFAIHPLHVESVAWITERKDVLYSFFFLSALICYVQYVKNNYQLKYLIFTFVLFVLSFMAKPAAVCLSPVLILIDYYYSRKLFSTRVILEKLPFLLLSIAFGIITIIIQKEVTASNIETAFLNPSYTILDRFFLVCYAIDFYIIKLICPCGLCAIYYFPQKVNGFLPIEYYFTPLMIFLIIGLIYKSGAHRKYLIWGFLFYFFTIFVVLQIIPVGRAIASDRYSYIPYIGLGYIAGYFFNYFNKHRFRLNILMFCCVLIFSFLTWNRNKIWGNNINFFKEVVEKYPSESDAWAVLADARNDIKDYQGALKDYNHSIALKQTAHIFNERGLVKCSLKNYEDAILDFNKCVDLDSSFAQGYYNRAFAREKLDQNYKSAIKDYTLAAKFRPKHAPIYNNRGYARYLTGDYWGALEDCNHVVELLPDSSDSYFHRGMVRTALKQYLQAVDDYNKALQLNSGLVEIYTARGVAKLKLKYTHSACADWQIAVKNGSLEAQKYIEMYCK